MTYPGGKGSVYQHIINQMPPHRIYIELFLGGGSVMLNKRSATLNIGIDLDCQALEDFSWSIATNGDRCRIHSLDMAMDHIAMKDGASASPKMAIRTNRPAHTAKNGDSAGDIAKNDGVTSLVWGDAIQLLEQWPFRGDELIYADPPYLRSVRSSKRPLYEHEFWTDSQHKSLLRLLKKLPCHVILSGYWSKLYASILSDWRTVTYPAVKRSGETVTEYLWCNFPEPKQLHDYRYLGDDFRERERIKRKKKRWIAKLKAMPRLERLAILAEIEESGLL